MSQLCSSGLPHSGFASLPAVLVPAVKDGGTLARKGAMGCAWPGVAANGLNAIALCSVPKSLMPTLRALPHACMHACGRTLKHAHANMMFAGEGLRMDWRRQ